MFLHGVLLLSLIYSTSDAACPRNIINSKICSGHGECNNLGECDCNEKFAGPDCSIAKCPMGISWSGYAIAVDDIHYLTECSNHGKCDTATGTCVCDNGFEGDACQRVKCPNNCNNRGVCVSMKELARHNPHGDDREYEQIWDANKIYGCSCDHGYSGVDCSIVDCPKGDDPMTSGQVNEVHLLTCTSVSGSFQLYFNSFGTVLNFDDTSSQVEEKLHVCPHIKLPTISKVSVSFSAGNTVCNAAETNVVKIEFLQDFGSLPPIKVYTAIGSTSTISLGSDVIVATKGEVIGTEISVTGTKEGEACSNRGVCDQVTGKCSCFIFPMPGYRSSDGYGNPGNKGECGAVDNQNKYGGPITSCPGEIPCSGHGVCTPTSFRCECEAGWTGGDCGLRTCHSGKSWFHIPTENNNAHNTMTVCSTGGLCDSISGECQCVDPFTGPGCEYMACPGRTAICSGHGQCLSNRHLALESEVNGESAGFLYGSKSNDPNTWDADRILGCKCDAEYEGHDCSKRSCPSGHDPSKTGRVDEMQILQCTATGGTFRLSFRQATTPDIPFDASAEELTGFLQSLPTINDVEVLYSTGLIACTPDSVNFIRITFLTNPGNLPSILFDSAKLTTSGASALATDGAVLGGFTSIAGTKENEVCSNKGHCDYSTGLCTCLPGYSSSDGRGNPGVRADCGAIV